MDAKKRKKLEKAGWKVGDASDFLGLDEAEASLIDLKTRMALAIRKAREGLKITQKELAATLHTDQGRISKIENADPEVSLDLMFKARFALDVHHKFTDRMTKLVSA